MHKGTIIFLFPLLLVGCANLPKEEEKETGINDFKITVLYTNDVHGNIRNIDSENNVVNSYAKLRTYKDSKENCLLVDAGDHVQGSLNVCLDKGNSISKIMGKTGYDVATLGNHEFDYGMDRTLELISNSDFPYIASNFYRLENGVRKENVVDSYKIFNVGGKKISFVGIVTPHTFTDSVPKYFQDDKGNYIYGLSLENGGENLYRDVQDAIDSSKEAGADYVIAVGHCGNEEINDPFSSANIVKNTTGLNAFIDGHSHEVCVKDIYKDKNGKDVIVSQTGTAFANVGELTISNDCIESKLIKLNDISENNEVKQLEDTLIKSVDDRTSEKIAECSFDLTINYEDSGKRAIRSGETNLGDLVADSYYYATTDMNLGIDVDCAIVNGGAIRSTITKGEITLGQVINSNPFGNTLCICAISGQDILDALEMGARKTNGDHNNPIENGGFLQVAGLKYVIDNSIASTVDLDENGMWMNGPNELDDYRVKNVEIYDKETKTFVPIELDKKYNVCGTSYTIANCGDGFTMFNDCEHIIDGFETEYIATANYITSFTDKDSNQLANVETQFSPLEDYPMNYESSQGAGRIKII